MVGVGVGVVVVGVSTHLKIKIVSIIFIDFIDIIQEQKDEVGIKNEYIISSQLT